MAKIIEELLERFLADPYLSRKIPPYLDMMVLIKRVVNKIEREILPTIKQKNFNKLKKICLELGYIHKKIQINEMMFFKEVDFFCKRLRENKDILELNDNEISLWIKSCEKGVALAYMESLIEDVLISFENGNPYRKYFEKLLKLLKKQLEILEEGKVKETLQVAIPKCPICNFISSVEFVIKSYFNPQLRLRLEAEHKDYHQYLTNFFEHLALEKFAGAAAILRELVLKIYAIDSLLKEIALYWELEGWKNFYGFLADSYYSNGLLRVVVPKSGNEKIRHRLVKDFIKILNHKLDLLEKDDGIRKYLFILPVDGAVYIYIDHNLESYDGILETLNNAVSEANAMKTLLLQEGIIPPYGIGEVETRHFHKASPELVEDIVKLMENRIIKSPVEGGIVKFDFEFDVLLLEAIDNLNKKEYVVKSIKDRKISLFYQPIADLSLKNTFGVELLARVLGNRGIPIPASFFIEFVKESNLTIEFDLAVLTTVLENLDTLEKIHKILFVNIFPDSLSDKEVIELLLNLLEEMEKRNMKLVLELTEHTIITNKEVLEKIERGNLLIAFDDFGSGYTNFKTVALLAHKRRARLLKVDGELIKVIAESEVHRKVVETIVEFAKNLDMGVIFEYVSDKRIYNLVKEITERKRLKKAYIQGFYVANPQPAVLFSPLVEGLKGENGEGN